MVLDLALDDFGHQAVYSTATCRYLLQHRSTVLILSDSVFDALKLSLNAIDARNELFFGSGDVTQLY